MKADKARNASNAVLNRRCDAVNDTDVNSRKYKGCAPRVPKSRTGENTHANK